MVPFGVSRMEQVEDRTLYELKKAETHVEERRLPLSTVAGELCVEVEELQQASQVLQASERTQRVGL